MIQFALHYALIVLVVLLFERRILRGIINNFEYERTIMYQCNADLESELEVFKIEHEEELKERK